MANICFGDHFLGEKCNIVLRVSSHPAHLILRTEVKILVSTQYTLPAGPPTVGIEFSPTSF